MKGQIQLSWVQKIGGREGLCAVFRISNVTSNYFVDYHGVAIEVRTNANSPWLTFKSKSSDDFMGGTWTPGYSSLFAMQWPPEAPTDSTWRVVVNVERQRRGVRRMINDRLGRQVFRLPNYAQHTIRSTEVDGSVPFGMPNVGSSEDRHLAYFASHCSTRSGREK